MPEQQAPLPDPKTGTLLAASAGHPDALQKVVTRVWTHIGSMQQLMSKVWLGSRFEGRDLIPTILSKVKDLAMQGDKLLQFRAKANKRPNWLRPLVLSIFKRAVPRQIRYHQQKKRDYRLEESFYKADCSGIGGGEIQIPAKGEPPEVLAIQAEMKSAIHKALQELAAKDPRAAEIINLRIFEGLKRKEICVRLQIEDWQITRAIDFSRKVLKAQLKSHIWDHG